MLLKCFSMARIPSVMVFIILHYNWGTGWSGAPSQTFPARNTLVKTCKQHYECRPASHLHDVYTELKLHRLTFRKKTRATIEVEISPLEVKKNGDKEDGSITHTHTHK